MFISVLHHLIKNISKDIESTLNDELLHLALHFKYKQCYRTASGTIIFKLIKT